MISLGEASCCFVKMSRSAKGAPYLQPWVLTVLHTRLHIFSQLHLGLLRSNWCRPCQVDSLAEWMLFPLIETQDPQSRVADGYPAANPNRYLLALAGRRMPPSS